MCLNNPKTPQINSNLKQVKRNKMVRKTTAKNKKCGRIRSAQHEFSGVQILSFFVAKFFEMHDDQFFLLPKRFLDSYLLKLQLEYFDL